MATIESLKQTVNTNLPSGVISSINAKKIRDSITAVIDHFGVSAFSASLNYNAATVYDLVTNPFCISNERLWEALQVTFSGQAPPTDPLVSSNFYWQEVSQSNPSAISEWVAGAYGNGLQIVYYNGSLYELVEPVRPFVSADFVAELASGAWEIIQVLEIAATTVVLGTPNTILLDLKSNAQLMFEIASVTTDATLSYTNDSKKRVVNLLLANVVGTISITLPATTKMEKNYIGSSPIAGEYSWDEINKVLTINGDTGFPFELSFAFDTAGNGYLKVSNAYQ